MTSSQHDADVLLAGGGLANTLIALRLKVLRPALRVVIIERGATLGGNHTWSFHTSDVTPRQYRDLEPLIAARWPRQEVRFPGHTRTLETGYNSVTSERLHQAGMAALGADARLSTAIAEVTPTAIVLTDGRRLTAPLVIDGLGPMPDTPMASGYQKFVGLEIETTSPHGVAHPLIMDATVEQADGYRFVYLLPFTPRRVLIEDTYYSDDAALDVPALVARIHAYAAQRGWTIERIIRRETGVLPITLAGRIDEHWRRLGPALPRVGLRGWLFHATTGYSLPNAVRVADAIAAATDLTSPAIARLVEGLSRTHWRNQRLFRLLNRCLFLAAEQPARRRVLERFYLLPLPAIEHFYAGGLRGGDIARLAAVMAARPPLAVSRALGCISEAKAWRKADAAEKLR